MYLMITQGLITFTPADIISDLIWLHLQGFLANNFLNIAENY